MANSELPVEGKQFVVAIQDKKDVHCYHDKEEFDSLAEAQKSAGDWSVMSKLPAIVFDRKSAEGIVYQTHKLYKEFEKPEVQKR